jgi:phage terminase large subunit-like protein
MSVKLYRPALARARKIARAMLVEKSPEDALAARADFIAFRQYVCSHESYAHHLEWESILNAGINSKCLTGIGGPNTLILAPRGSAKSTFLVQWTAWVIGKMTAPEIRLPLKILYVSYTIDVAILKSIEIKQILESEKYQLVFPWVRPGERWTDKIWLIDRKHAGLPTISEPYTLACSGLKGVATGKRCLTGDTLVFTSGGQIPISQVVVGTWVATFHEATDAITWGRVAAVTSRSSSNIYLVKTASKIEIKCTFDHPFYVLTKGWVDAKDLVLGNKVYKLKDRIIKDIITEVRSLPGLEATVWDIEVEESHNFFANNILVHNSHLVILDDLIKSPEQIDSVDIREKMERNWTSVIRPTMFEGARAVCLGTRMRADDIYNSTFVPDRGWIQKIQSAILEMDGAEASYWEAGQSLEHLLKLREDDPVAFSFQFQNQIIRVSEQSIDPTWIISADIPDIEDMERLVIGLDLSASLKERADWTAIVLVGKKAGFYYFIDMRRIRAIGNIEKLDAIISLWVDWGCPRVEIAAEANAYQSSFAGDFTSYVVNDKKIVDITCMPIQSRGDKLQRLRSITGMFQNKRVIFNRYVNFGRLKEELINWGSVGHDDCSDAAEKALSALRDRRRLEMVA